MSIKPSDCNRILIIKLSSIGDVVMATPVAKALRRAFPESYMAWAVEAKSKDVVVGNPYVDEVIVSERNSGSGISLRDAIGFVRSFTRLGRDLRTRKFDIAIDIQGLFRSALAALMSGARHRLGYDNAREGAALCYNARLPMRQRSVRGPQQYLSMLELLGIFTDDLDMHMPIGEDDRAFARDFLAAVDSGRTPGKRAVVALCPATTWPQKHWTEEGWARLADMMVSNYNAVPIFLGSQTDTPLVDRIRNLAKCETVDATGRTTLKQAAAIFEQSDLVVGVDTGLLHIGLALDRPVVGLFGSTSWQHFAKKDSFAVVAKTFPCMPCYRHPICRNFDCMKAITVDEVLTAASRWLTKKAAT